MVRIASLAGRMRDGSLLAMHVQGREFYIDTKITLKLTHIRIGINEILRIKAIMSRPKLKVTPFPGSRRRGELPGAAEELRAGPRQRGGGTGCGPAHPQRHEQR